MIRAAVDLQAQFQEVATDVDIPLRVRIGIDSGEVVQLEDGSFRGAALSTSRRDCAEEIAATNLASVVPPAIRRECHVQTVPNAGADETAACVPAQSTPDRWEISRYPNGPALAAAYRNALGNRADISRDSGRCNAFVWGGENVWNHGPGKPGGRVFCYFDGNDAVIGWFHERLDQNTHRDILVTAREGGSDHAA